MRTDRVCQIRSKQFSACDRSLSSPCLQDLQRPYNSPSNGVSVDAKIPGFADIVKIDIDITNSSSVLLFLWWRLGRHVGIRKREPWEYLRWALQNRRGLRGTSTQSLGGGSSGYGAKAPRRRTLGCAHRGQIVNRAGIKRESSGNGTRTKKKGPPVAVASHLLHATAGANT